MCARPSDLSHVGEVRGLLLGGEPGERQTCARPGIAPRAAAARHGGLLPPQKPQLDRTVLTGPCENAAWTSYLPTGTCTRARLGPGRDDAMGVER